MDDAERTRLAERARAGASVDAVGTTVVASVAQRLAYGSSDSGVGDGGTQDLPVGDRVERGASAAEPAVGELLGHFVVRRRLGEGGMGVVYAGDDPDLGRAVAIKLVRGDADAPAYRARLLREAQAMARLEHPNVVKVYEVGSAGGRLFVAMELVEGTTLTQWLAATRRAWREIVAMFAQVGQGLAAVHAVGLVHRDFKPDNVLVDHGGRARVADFGLARLDADGATDGASPALAQPLTRTGALMGTPGFMAPEQQFGAGVDARADQYSFCVALREALCGGGDASWRGAPRAVRDVVKQGLAYDASERFASMDELLAALTRPIRPRKLGFVAGAVVAALVVAGGVAVASAVISDGDGGSTQRAAAAALPAPTPAPATIASNANPIAIPPTAMPDAEPLLIDQAVAALMSDAHPAIATATAIDAGVAPLTNPGDAPAITRGTGAMLPGSKTSPTNVVLQPPPPLVPAKDAADDAPVVHPPPGPMNKADLPAVRAAIRDLGYRGLPLGELDADVAGSLANFQKSRDQFIAEAKDGDTRIAIATAGIAMMLRRAGDCRRARAEAATAMQAFAKLKVVEQRDLEGTLWLGRAVFVQALCMLDAGEAAASLDRFKLATEYIGWGHGGEVQQAEAQLAWGIAIFEAGDRMRAHGAIHTAGVRGDDLVHAAMEPWMKAVGMTWDETWDWR